MVVSKRIKCGKMEGSSVFKSLSPHCRENKGFSVRAWSQYTYLVVLKHSLAIP